MLTDHICPLVKSLNLIFILHSDVITSMTNYHITSSSAVKAYK